MKLIRDKEQYKLQLTDDNGVILLELGFITDEFVFTFYTTMPVVISEFDDEFLYNYLQSIMDNEYDFSNKFSTKKDNEIIWFSDQYCDLENEYETDKINRLTIKKEENKFVLFFDNPFFDKNTIKMSHAMVAFSPAGNGSYSRNLITNSSFQDDIIIAFHNIMNKKSLNKTVKLTRESI